MPISTFNSEYTFPSFVQQAQMAEGNERSLDKDTLTNMYQQMQNERYGQMTPHEVDIKSGEAAKANAINNPASMDQYRLGQEGQWQSQAATGTYDAGVVKGKIAEKLAEMKAKMPKHQFDQETAELEQLRRGLEMGIPQLEQIPQGMMRNQAAMKMAQEFGIDPNTVAMIAEKGGLNDLEGLKQLQAQITYALENTTGHRQSMQKEELKAVTGLEQTRMQTDSNLQAAELRRKDEIAALLNTLKKEASKGNPEAFQMLADMADDPTEKKRYMELAVTAAQRREAERRALATGKIDVGAATGGQVPTMQSTNPYGQPAAPQQTKKWNSQTKKWE